MSGFANVLRALRNQMQMSQQELANAIGISKSALNMYERGERQPNFETLELIADYFNISIDFLLGKENFIHCPICNNIYDPLNKHDILEHDAFHQKFINAENKYGKILSYEDANKKRNDCIFKLNNPTLSDTERISAFEDCLKYEFVLSLWRNSLDLDHEDFEVFCKKEMGLAVTKEALENISPNVYQTFLDRYGRAYEEDYHKVNKINKKNDFDIKEDIENMMKKLSNKEYAPVVYDGKPISKDYVEMFADQIEIMLRRLKVINEDSNKS